MFLVTCPDLPAPESFRLATSGWKYVPPWSTRRSRPHQRLGKTLFPDRLTTVELLNKKLGHVRGADVAPLKLNERIRFVSAQACAVGN